MKNLTTLILLLVSMITSAQDKIFVHTATASNITGHITTIDHPDLNGNPNACLNYTHNWNPNGTDGIYNDNVDGLYYDGSNWAIFNENIGNAMVEGASFNVYIASSGSCIDHIATTDNTGGNYTNIDDPSFNGANPGPYAFMNHYWNPNSVYNTGRYGMFYNSAADKRAIFNENIAQAPAPGTAFKILDPDGAGLAYMTHEANASNTTSNVTVINHSELNGNPNATFLISHYWGVTGASSEVYINANLGVYYNGSNWAIYTEDLSAMPEGITFDIVIAPQELDIDEFGNNENTSVIAYPNPVLQSTTITSKSPIKQIRLFNVLGEEVLKVSVNSVEVQLDLSQLQSGVYFTNVEAENGNQTLKIIKK